MLSQLTNKNKIKSQKVCKSSEIWQSSRNSKKKHEEVGKAQSRDDCGNFFCFLKKPQKRHLESGLAWFGSFFLNNKLVTLRKPFGDLLGNFGGTEFGGSVNGFRPPRVSFSQNRKEPWCDFSKCSVEAAMRAWRCFGYHPRAGKPFSWRKCPPCGYEPISCIEECRTFGRIPGCRADDTGNPVENRWGILGMSHLF